MGKLTLSANKDVVNQARKLAAANKTSISSMFERFVRLMSRKNGVAAVGPVTRKATGLITLPRGKGERQVLEEALLEKYKIKP